MTQEHTATNRLTLTGRSGSSRKLLQRKAAEKSVMTPVEEELEESFPACAEQQQDNAQEPESSSSSALAAPLGHVPALAPAWSSEDEGALQALLARRKAAGYQRRGKDVGGQLICLGEIRPNPDTVVATIVGIVAERGQISRAELIASMASAVFPHPKAQPQDKSWCQGYVAGAIRSGFLAVRAAAAEAASEFSAAATEPASPAEEA